MHISMLSIKWVSNLVNLKNCDWLSTAIVENLSSNISRTNSFESWRIGFFLVWNIELTAKNTYIVTAFWNRTLNVSFKLYLVSASFANAIFLQFLSVNNLPFIFAIPTLRAIIYGWHNFYRKGWKLYRIRD